MATFVAMEKERIASAAGPQFVPDRFSLIAFLVPAVWLLWHRLWLEALAALAVSVALAALAVLQGHSGLALGLCLLFSLLVALEGGSLRIAALRRRGWRESAILEANDRDEAELRYLEGRLPIRRQSVAGLQPSARVARPAGGEMLGLIDYPGAR